MSTPIASIVCVADMGGAITPGVATAKAASALVKGRPNVLLANIGDTLYPQAQAGTVGHIATNFWFTGSSFNKGNSIACPGNHDNGPGGADPSAAAYLQAWTGTLAKTTGVSPPIPITDQFIDVGGWRVFLIQSGAVEVQNPVPGWPVPHLGTFSATDPRVVWLRKNWLPGLNNIVMVHHMPRSVYGHHLDNKNMANLFNEAVGHASLMIGGHDHNMQIFNPRSGIVEVICGGCEGHYQGNPPSGNTQPSALQFANDTTLGFGLIEVMSASEIKFSLFDQAGKPMANTPALGRTGASSVDIVIGTPPPPPPPPPTAQYTVVVDGGTPVPVGSAIQVTLGPLAPGPHTFLVEDDAVPPHTASYGWTQN